jgi:hypothetical protein
MLQCKNMKEYLQVSEVEVIDWQHPTILQLAQQIGAEYSTPVAIALILMHSSRLQKKN